MAQSTYGTSTLLGNFQEEQSTAPPLRGVLPNMGPNDYQTTHKADLTLPQKNRQYRPERNNRVHRLITKEYIEDMAVGTAASSSDRFVDVLARADPSKVPESGGYWETSAANAFGGKPPRKGRRAAALQAQRGSGGQPKAQEKVPTQSGAYGERLRVNEDPQNDSRAQRSWVYGGANMFEENQKRKDQSKLATDPVQPTSLTLGGDPKRNSGNNARSSTEITRGRAPIAKRGAGIYAD